MYPNSMVKPAEPLIKLVISLFCYSGLSGWVCGAGQAGDLWTWTTFQSPFIFTITRLSL
jgi:hypothetical protein